MKGIISIGTVAILLFFTSTGYGQKSNLIGAAGRGDIGSIKKLLDDGADVNAKETATGRTPLSLKGRTALILAAYFGHPKVVQTLLDKGANIEVKDASGYTAIDFARAQKQNINRRFTEEDTLRKEEGLVCRMIGSPGLLVVSFSAFQSEVDRQPPM